MVRVAAVDCGTNSVRLLVADVDDRPGPEGRLIGDGRLVDVVRRMEIVRLGQGVDATGRLAPEAIERTRVALASYAVDIRRLGAERVRMVATSASRDAENADEFRAMVVATLGVPPEVVTGDEEARLSFDGAVRGLPPNAEAPYLVVDIGGGSTEFVRGGSTLADNSMVASSSTAGRSIVDSALSVDIGCVRMTERHLRSDPPTPAEIASARSDVVAAVDRALDAVSGAVARTLVGLAGSVTTVAAIALGLDGYRPERIHHARVRYAEVAKVTADLLAATRERRLAIPVMHPGRADVIGAGALILQVIMERSGVDSVVASEHDILDGIAWTLA